MTSQEFEARIVEWAERRDDVQALILGGSRALPSGKADDWSDWDFHLVTNNTERYSNTDWLEGIAPVWSAFSERTPRGVIKVSAVFEGGFEADFVPLAQWQMKIVYWCMNHPEWKHWMPTRVRRGVQETRAFLLGSGYRVLVGGDSWSKRLEATQASWPAIVMSGAEFEKHTAAFWQKSVWVCKKIARPEPRSAIHWLHALISEHVYALLAEEARLAGRVSRSNARKAEQWLEEKRIVQTAVETNLVPATLASALLAEIALFEDVSVTVARSRGFDLKDYSAVARWLREILTPLARGD